METGGLIAVGVFALLCILSVVTSIRFWLRLWGLSDQLNTLIEQNETANKQRKAANALLGEMVQRIAAMEPRDPQPRTAKLRPDFDAVVAAEMSGQQPPRPKAPPLR